MKKQLPKVTFSIAAYNGGELLQKALISIRKQNYPQNKIEIIVIDDNSTDNTIEIAKSYKAQVFKNGKRDMYLSQKIGLHEATGEFFYLLDQDIELKSRDFIIKMLEPLLIDSNITGSMTRAYPRKDQPWVTRFISYQPFQCDPLFEYLTPSIEKSIVAKKSTYYLCRFILGKIPAESRVFYRLSILKKTPNWKMDRIYDHDLLINTVKSGFDQYAYVPDAGIYHHHAKDLQSLVKKRMRNLTAHYFPMQNQLAYRWLDIGDKYQILRLAIWIVYANLFIPELIKGLIRFVRYKDWALIMQPIVSISTTDAIIWTFLKNGVGREIAISSIKTLAGINESKTKGAFGR